MKTSCSFIAYKHRHRYYFFISKFRHVASFWKFGEGVGGGRGQPHSKNFDEQKEKRKKREFRNLEKWRRRDSTIIEFYMCKIQINVCTKKKESGETGPHHLSPCRDATCLKSTIFKKIMWSLKTGTPIQLVRKVTVKLHVCHSRWWMLQRRNCHFGVGCKLDRIKTNGLYSFSKENTCKALTDFYLKIKVTLTGTSVFVNVLDSTLYIVYNIHVC